MVVHKEPLKYKSHKELRELTKIEVLKYYNQEVWEGIKTGKYRSMDAFRDRNLQVVAEDRYRVIYYTIGTEYEWLINTKHTSFKYDGMLFENYNRFVYYYKIITKKLMRDISKFNGDVKKAILKNEGNPEFQFKIEFTYKRKKYTSVSLACEDHGVAVNTVVSKMRDGMTVQEALESAIIGRNENYGEFTYKELGITYSQFLEEHNLVNATLYSLANLHKVTPYELILNIDEYYITIGDKRYSNVYDISQEWGIGRELVVSILKKAESNDQLYNSDELYRLFSLAKEKLLYEGKQYKGYGDLAKDIGTSSNAVSSIFNKTETKEEFDNRIRNLIETVEIRRTREGNEAYKLLTNKERYQMLKLFSITEDKLLDNIERYTIRAHGKEYLSITALSKEVGLSSSTIIKRLKNVIIQKVSAGEDLGADLDRLAKRLTFKGKRYESLSQMAKDLGLLASPLAKIWNKDLPAQEFEQEVDRYIQIRSNRN